MGKSIPGSEYANEEYLEVFEAISEEYNHEVLEKVFTWWWPGIGIVMFFPPFFLFHLAYTGVSAGMMLLF